jgi:ABC-type phosphate/phosphonate transport system substrate-binding protein
MASTWIRPEWALLACAAAVVLALPAAGRDDPAVLLIGSSGATTDPTARRREEASRPTLQRFIKTETGLDNKITYQKDWRDLADRLARGELHLGVFEGYELAWAQERRRGLKALAVAVNVHRYPVACVMVRRDSPVKGFAGLQGRSIYLPREGPHHLRLFVEQRCRGAGKSAAAFFAKITSQESVEDALDDVVDGVIVAAAVDHAGLDAYKQRKPGRARQLQELTRSQPFPPCTVAYHGATLSEALRQRFVAGLLAAHRKERGRTMLASFRVTAFQAVPDDYPSVLARSRKDYPAPVEPTK